MSSNIVNISAFVEMDGDLRVRDLDLAQWLEYKPGTERNIRKLIKPNLGEIERHGTALSAGAPYQSGTDHCFRRKRWSRLAGGQRFPHKRQLCHKTGDFAGSGKTDENDEDDGKGCKHS